MTINELKLRLEESDSIKLVTQALGELAAMELKGTRGEVLQNTNFFNEIATIYKDVKIVATKHQLLNKKAPVLNPKNGKTIAVLLTSNQGFFGGLDNKLTETYINTTRQFPTDRLVVGKFAHNLLEANKYPEAYTQVIFVKDMPTPEELKQLVAKTIDYSKVLIFHPKFITPLHQDCEISDISQSQDQEVAESKLDYIVEPEIDKMLLFFEGQLLTSLFKAIFLQAQLSRTAARMISMYEAELNIDKEITKEKRGLNLAKQTRQNILILETYSGIRHLLELS